MNSSSSATLLRRQIMPDRLIISGVDIKVTRRTDGSIQIAGLEAKNNQKRPDSGNELAEWLFAQRLIELENLTVIWNDENIEQDPITFISAGQ